MPHALDPQRAAQHGGAVMRLVDEIFPLVEGFYVDLHKNPELSHQEHRTAGAVAEWLARAGFEVATGIGGTGVVGVLRNGEGPTVLLRGDMDALPVEEKTGLPYASTARGVDDEGRDVPIMHACGHDAHTACLVGAADLLAGARDHWRGTLMVVAQPGEETLDGAEAMLRDGLYTRFGRPDIVLGQHLGSQPAGMVAHRAGPLMAASTQLRVRVFGTGGHAARPDAAVDPVVIAASIVTRLQTIVAREVSPSEMAVVTVGRISAGTKANVIPDEALLEIDTRALNPAVTDRLHDAIDRIVRAEAAASGARREPEITVVRETDITANSPEATAQVLAAHRAYFGDGYVVELPEPVTASEDFGAFGLPGDPEPVPYVYWFLGGTPHQVWESAPGQTPYEKLQAVPANHSPFFAPDREPVLRAGLAAMAVGALAYLGRGEDPVPTGGQAAFSAAEPPPAPASTAAAPDFAPAGGRPEFPATPAHGGAPLGGPAEPAVARPGDAAPYGDPYPAGPVPPGRVPPTAAYPDPLPAPGAPLPPPTGPAAPGTPPPPPAGSPAGTGPRGGHARVDDDEGEPTAATDMADHLGDDDPPAPPAPSAAPPQGPAIMAPPPQGPPVAAPPPPPPGAAPYPPGGDRDTDRDRDRDRDEPPYYDPSARYDSGQEPPQDPPYRL
ncbi:amidohydrolase [Streptomonospora sp. S1-112]|uniref:Amidohydrolase n=1 Tax=Streptomonospora mangrovi TaxID=2883123 RepID=A0A9X3SJZ3_9ACTN|nr:amidohydrolase [Streptomonospora mangrovi]MDA0567899.1 amidohydrolase [Streptomonospora mangrovi]